MKDDTKQWIDFANENYLSAKILLKQKLFNPCLQNVQQAVEKYLKAIFIESQLKLIKTHDVLKIKNLLLENSIEIAISDDDCDFINSIYLPSKYPIGSALPSFEPNEAICNQALKITKNVKISITNYMK